MAIIFVLCSLSRLYYNTFSPSKKNLWGKLSDKHKALIEWTELAGVEKFMLPIKDDPIGRPRHKRQPIAVAFPAKAVWNDSTPRALLDRLGGGRMST